MNVFSPHSVCSNSDELISETRKNVGNAVASSVDLIATNSMSLRNWRLGPESQTDKNMISKTKGLIAGCEVYSHLI